MILSIVIPTFNERENVRTITTRIYDAMEQTNVSYEIVFVDDSVDDTPDVLAELMKTHTKVRYIHRTERSGLGTAVVEGFHTSEGQYIVVMDADLQHPPELLPRIVERMQDGVDVVIPSRFVTGGSDGGLNVVRKFISWTARSLGRIAIKKLRPISDCTSGYFAVRRDVVDGVQLDPIGWKILIEVLVKGSYETVHELAYAFDARDAGESKMSMREQWNYLHHLAKLVSNSPEDRRFYLFAFVGGLGTLVNLAVMSALYYGFGIHGELASVIASIVAMAHNFLWNDLVTWKDHESAVSWHKALQIPTFIAISVVSIVITELFAILFLRLHWVVLLGQLLGILIATGWSYIANNRWTWRSRPEQARKRGVRVTREESR